jgi:APA family basic amino acid/polyamine antiporter
VANLVLEYVLSNAAVVRGFSPYFALLVGKADPNFFLVPWRGYLLDW